LNKPLIEVLYLLLQINDLKREDLGGMRLEPTDTNILVWSGAIPGPEGSPYQDGIFEFDLTLPVDYP
jgi:ubiquitin-conjugating enzyme E2 D/E